MTHRLPFKLYCRRNVKCRIPQIKTFFEFCINNAAEQLKLLNACKFYIMKLEKPIKPELPQ